MSEYLMWDRKTITDFSEENIVTHYKNGYVFTRRGKGVMDQTRSLRVDLNEFTLSSENRRILSKTEDIKMFVHPLPCGDYHWSIHKMGKDFYDEKFGPGTMSANKIKEMMVDSEKTNFNHVFIYSTSEHFSEELSHGFHHSDNLGYCIARNTGDIMHYSYPFYDLTRAPKNMGMGMMIKAIAYAKNSGKHQIYLGSFQRPGDIYKLQFKGLEWFDGKKWSKDVSELKELAKKL